MAQHRVHVRLQCRHRERDLCVLIRREVPQALRCVPGPPASLDLGGTPCDCASRDLEPLILSELRDSLQEWLRLGYVGISLT